MKKLILFIFIITSTLLQAQEMNIASYNIRFNNPNDGVNAWPNRIEMVTSLISFHHFGIFGLQEALYGQIKDIENALPDYQWFGTGRDDGKRDGEFSPIFFNSKLFKLVSHGQFWLSETPEKPGLGWDAVCNRVCTWGKFIQNETGKEFYVLNTHFDHKGNIARSKSAKLIINNIVNKTRTKASPLILTGDFNLTPEQLPITLIKKELNDSREVSIKSPYGPKGTFNAFKHDHLLDKRIDYIFVNKQVEVLTYAVLSDSKENRYPSDHLPVLVKVKLK